MSNGLTLFRAFFIHSYFANERTFIQWISGGLLLVTVAALVLDFQSDRAGSLAVGFALTCCASVIVCYATFVYYRRVHLLRSASPYGYIDVFGPILLAGSVLIGVVILLIYFYETQGETNAIHDGTSKTTTWRPTITTKAGTCTQHGLNGISLFEYQPSDVFVDSTKDFLLVPSLARITSIPKSHSGNGTVSVLAEIPGADLEAVTSDGHRVFAVSEDDKNSRVFEFKWNAGNLEQVQELRIPTNRVEGIAYVPAPDGLKGKLYVAGNNVDSKGQTVGIVDVYSLPPMSSLQNMSSSSELTPQRLNNRLINQGLDNSKIGALYYFEDLLYILHDNAKVVRVWNIEHGTLLAEWNLPFVEGGFAKQWEGMALERNPWSLSLTLHLALDSPPQVWSLAVEEGNVPGSLILPKCAAAAPNK